MRADITVEKLNAYTGESFPGYVGVTITALGEGRLSAEMPLMPHHIAPNGFLHAGAVVTLADTAAGYATVAHLPSAGHNFATVELKTNFLGTAREGLVTAEAQALHLGRTTQVWDVTVSHEGQRIALFRCTQMVLAPR
jgi:uncharacterized protein (TIGR00369 family)